LLRYLSKRNLTPCRNETPQRRHNILALLNERGEVSVDELAKRFETSEVTIRKDLAALESNGLLLRRYGGASPCRRNCGEPPSRSAYKAIARAAVGVSASMRASSSTAAVPPPP
jgi:DeoR/GlpR family transcriptional regulator of sugar metabolism